jgi:hypothetical protein
MTSGNVDLEARYVEALRTQPKSADAPLSDALPCPYCSHQGRIFQTVDQLFAHAKVDHAAVLQALQLDPARARAHVMDASMKM